MFNGAGGNEGGIGSFLLGLGMMMGGGYLLLDSIRVVHGFGFGHGLYRFGNVQVTSGMILIPFIIGIVMVFANSKSWIGWILVYGSTIGLIFGVIRSIQFSFVGMSAFDLMVIFVLFFGGIGLLLGSMRKTKSPF